MPRAIIGDGKEATTLLIERDFGFAIAFGSDFSLRT
jgi:hypothetical protein